MDWDGLNRAATIGLVLLGAVLAAGSPVAARAALRWRRLDPCDARLCGTLQRAYLLQGLLFAAAGMLALQGAGIAAWALLTLATVLPVSLARRLHRRA